MKLRCPICSPFQSNCKRLNARRTLILCVVTEFLEICALAVFLKMSPFLSWQSHSSFFPYLYCSFCCSPGTVVTKLPTQSRSLFCFVWIICLMLFQSRTLMLRSADLESLSRFCVALCYLFQPLFCFRDLYTSSSWQPLWSALVCFCHVSALLIRWFKIILSPLKNVCGLHCIYSCPESANLSGS